MIFRRPHGPQYSILTVLGMLHTWAQSAFYIQWPPNLATIKYTSIVLVSVLPELASFQGFTSAGIDRAMLTDSENFPFSNCSQYFKYEIVSSGEHQHHLAHQC